MASTINATKMNSKYMLVQRYICQATHIIHSPSASVETRYTFGTFEGIPS
jgi:hypothetical protein